jgi:AAA family ATP:ADP antiporter
VKSVQQQTGSVDKLSVFSRFGIHVHEAEHLILSAALFFCILCSFYILRPLRDETAILFGVSYVQYALSITFLIMLAIIPVVGALVSYVPRRLILPIVYIFFISNLLVFAAFLRFDHSNIWISGAFTVWMTVFSLVSISFFWSFMADIWASRQAERLYGFIALGGTSGALLGPVITQAFVGMIAPTYLLIVSAAFLALGLIIHWRLQQLRIVTSAGAADALPDRASILSGASHVWRSPYLLRIAIWTLISEMFAVFFYLEQIQALSNASMTQNERLVMLARVESVVGFLTMGLEVFVTARLLRSVGVAGTLSVGAIWALIGVVVLFLTENPIFSVIILAGARAIDNGITGPAMRVLYTIVDPRDKYRSQNFTDTAVVRGGNLLSVWLLNSAVQMVGVAAPIVTACAIPVALVWSWFSIDLGSRYKQVTASASAD